MKAQIVVYLNLTHQNLNQTAKQIVKERCYSNWNNNNNKKLPSKILNNEKKLPAKLLGYSKRFHLWNKAPFALTYYVLQFKFLAFFLAQTTIFLSVLFHSSKELMNQPMSIPCGHSACKTWLLEMISKQSIGSRPCTCQLCRARIEGDKLNVNVTVSALIGRIQVSCTKGPVIIYRLGGVGVLRGGSHGFLKTFRGISLN